jgi:uncharacterized membrane protein
VQVSRRRLTVLLPLIGASLLGVALVCARILASLHETYAFLVWNLFLAWLPLLFALALYDGYRRRTSPILLAALAAAWLLFFPNAPYVLTDFVHLAPRGGVSLWYDALTIATVAFTALLLGCASLYLVHSVVRRAAGERWGWATVAGAILLASVGIYLGRFLQVNSWDVLVDPHAVLAPIRYRLQHPLGNRRLIEVMVLFTAFLSLAYLSLYELAGARLELERGEPS